MLEEVGGYLRLVAVEQDEEDVNTDLLNISSVKIAIFDFDEEYYNDSIKNKKADSNISKYNRNVNWYMEN